MLAADAKGPVSIVQAVAQKLGGGLDAALVSNVIVLVKRGDAPPRVLSAKRFVIEENAWTYLAALAAAGALSTLLAWKRRPNVGAPKRWGIAAAALGAASSLFALAPSFPDPRAAFRSIDEKYADAFEPEFLAFVRTLRDASMLGARAVAIVRSDDTASEREILAARLRVRTLRLDMLTAPPASYEPYAVVIVAGDFPAPPGFVETFRTPRLALFEWKRR
jgi:hypothetical protein